LLENGQNRQCFSEIQLNLDNILNVGFIETIQFSELGIGLISPAEFSQVVRVTNLARLRQSLGSVFWFLISLFLALAARSGATT
jgi:hypothetical protein